MLAQRRRRWANTNPAFDKHLLFAGPFEPSQQVRDSGKETYTQCHLNCNSKTDNSIIAYFKLVSDWNRVRAWREQYGSTSEMDSIAKAVVFYVGGQCTLKPKIL